MASSNIGKAVQYTASKSVSAGVVVADNPVVLLVFGIDGPSQIVNDATQDDTQQTDNSYTFV
jgi:hypothetical protein